MIVRIARACRSEPVMIRRHAALQEGVRAGGRSLVRVESFFDDGGVVPDQLAHDLRECPGFAGLGRYGR